MRVLCRRARTVYLVIAVISLRVSLLLSLKAELGSSCESESQTIEFPNLAPTVKRACAMNFLIAKARWIAVVAVLLAVVVLAACSSEPAPALEDLRITSATTG